MNKKIKVNKHTVNCYIYNASGLQFIAIYLSAACLPYIMPALFHLGAGFFMPKY
jgi:hypothetical protein